MRRIDRQRLVEALVLEERIIARDAISQTNRRAQMRPAHEDIHHSRDATAIMCHEPRSTVR
ncbi:MAG: hypothetical protein WD354_04370 [Acidimicrobiia bacterium]